MIKLVLPKVIVIDLRSLESESTTNAAQQAHGIATVRDFARTDKPHSAPPDGAEERDEVEDEDVDFGAADVEFELSTHLQTLVLASWTFENGRACFNSTELSMLDDRHEFYPLACILPASGVEFS